MVNGQGQIVLVNQQTEKLFGYSRDELIGQSVEILVPERFRGDHAGYRAAFTAAPQARSMGAGRDLYARRKDGSEVRVEIGLNPIRTEQGLLVLTSIVDISERKKSEEALEKERAFLRQVIDIDPNFIFAKDREGRFTLANRAVAEAYGTTVEDLIGKTDADFNPHAEEVQSFHRMDLEVIDTLQERFIPEEPITDAKGKVRWLQTVKRPIIEKDGFANQVLGASTDITWRKATETELQRNRDELAHMTRVSTLGELAASLAHELNQPLTGILSNAQAAQRFLSLNPADLDEVREILKDIVDDDNRAAEVIQKLRALYKKEALAFAALDLPSVIDDVVQLVHSDAVLHNVRIALDADADLPPARGDKVQLQQVVLNLLRNAIDAMKDCPINDREMLVRAQRQDGGFLRVAVGDRGRGLTADKLDKIFQPFYTTKRDGLGMGLSVSRSIIEAHGGQLWAEINADRGATFYFTVGVEGAAGNEGRG
jgi:two-component system sensor kinase FixL